MSGDGIAFDSIAFGPFVFGEVVGAKNHIESWKMDRIVFVDCFFFNAVVPMMKSWCGNDVLEPVKPDADIGVDEYG